MSQPHSEESSTEPVLAAPVTLAATAIDSSEDEDENEDEELLHISLPQAMPCQHRLANPCPGLLPLLPAASSSSSSSSFSLALHSHLHPTLTFTTNHRSSSSSESPLSTGAIRPANLPAIDGERPTSTAERDAARQPVISRLLATALWTASEQPHALVDNHHKAG